MGSNTCSMKKVIHFAGLVVLLFCGFKNYAQSPEIFLVSEIRDGAKKNIRFIVSYKYIDVYSIENHPEDHGYDGYILSHLSRTRISKTDFYQISEAIDSSFGLPDGNPNEAVGGFQWKVVAYGILEEIRT